MAATGLLALLDDITAILDDVATMSKVAAQKTAGIAGDDLAVNTQGLVGLDPSRELPIVGRVALGSFVNKLILVPLALVLPHGLITPMLMLGGTFLCYEGVHKVMHKKDAHHDEHHDKLVAALKQGPEAALEMERGKVRQAILTDVILSAEIVAVALGAVADAPFATKAAVLSVVSIAMTIAIYGLVAGIVKLDDLGFYLKRTGAEGSPRARFGQFILDYTPTLMRVISIGGTAAMFLVGGGIVLHGFHSVEQGIHRAIEQLTHFGPAVAVLDLMATLLAGVIIGVAAVAVIEAVRAAIRVVRPGAFASH